LVIDVRMTMSMNCHALRSGTSCAVQNEVFTKNMQHYIAFKIMSLHHLKWKVYTHGFVHFKVCTYSLYISTIVPLTMLKMCVTSLTIFMFKLCLDRPC
jgi:hypothetical protein